MSSSSVARQNRRNRQRQLPPLAPILSKGHQTLSVIELLQKIKETKEKSRLDQQTAIKLKNDYSKEPVPSVTSCSLINCDMTSRPLEKIFVEDERGFRAIDLKDILESLNRQSLQLSAPSTKLAIGLAYKAATCFQDLSLFCHGLLGGMSLIHLMLLVHLITIQGEEKLLDHLCFISQPLLNIYNFLCIICCISVFDRYDVGHQKYLFEQIKKGKLKVIIVLLYPACLLLSLSTANIDEKMCSSQKNSTIYESFQNEDAENEMFYWKILGIAKCAGAVLAWVLMSLVSSHNQFISNLEGILQKNQLTA